jgi:hypothetical protein
VGGQRLLGPLQVEQRQTEIGMGLGRRRIDGERAADPVGGGGRRAALVVDQPGEMQRAEMPGVALQDAAIERLGLVQPALSVQGQPLLELGGGIGGSQRFLPPVVSGMAACSVRIRKVKLSSM